MGPTEHVRVGAHEFTIIININSLNGLNKLKKYNFVI